MRPLVFNIIIVKGLWQDAADGLSQRSIPSGGSWHNNDDLVVIIAPRSISHFLPNDCTSDNLMKFWVYEIMHDLLPRRHMRTIRLPPLEPMVSCLFLRECFVLNITVNWLAPVGGGNNFKSIIFSIRNRSWLYEYNRTPLKRNQRFIQCELHDVGYSGLTDTAGTTMFARWT